MALDELLALLGGADDEMEVAAPPTPSVVSTPAPKKGLVESILPLIAAGLATSQGGLPGFASTSQGNIQRRRSEDMAQQQMSMRQQQQEAAQQRADEALRIQQWKAESEEAARAAARQAATVKADDEFVWEWWEKVVPKMDEEAVDVINAGLDAQDQGQTPGFSLTLPSGANLNIKAALEKLGFGKRLPKPKPETTSRIPNVTTPGPGGKPVRAPDLPGTPIYERPRAPRVPRATPEPSAAFQDFAGKPTTVKRSEVLAAMRQQGLDESMIDELMKDPAALSELFQ